MQEPKLVFIVGCPRSGTSWTWGLLSSLNNVEPLLMSDFPTMENAHVSTMKTKEGFTTTETTVFYSNLTDDEIRHDILIKAKKNPGKSLLEKTPANTLKLERITALFPEAYITHVIRDPRATINSILQSTFSSGHKIANNIDEAIDLYLAYFEAAEKYDNYENLTRVRYEELLKSTEESIVALAKFCNIQVSEKEVKRAVRTNRNKSQTITSNDFRKGIADSYKTELSASDIRKIETSLSRIFETYEYKVQKKYSFQKLLNKAAILLQNRH